ncbi:MAG: glycoside hydrolase family 13 protein, partial [Clostridia bacterium]
KNAIIKYVKSGDAKELTTVIKEQIDHYPKVVLDGLMNILGTHDTVRIIDSLGGQEINGLSKQAQSELKLTSSERAQAKEKLKIPTP